MTRTAARIILAVVAFSGAAPSRAGAQTAVFVESESILAGRRWAPSFGHEADAARCREQADLSDYCRRLLVPFYEYLTLRADHFGTPGLSVEFAGWGVADSVDRFDPTKAARLPQHSNDPTGAGVGGDIMTGILTYRGLHNRLELRVGRQFMFLGAPYSTSFDGGYVRYTLPGDVDVAVYGGASLARDGTAGRDSFNRLMGARVAWSQLDRGNLGVSVLDETDGDGLVARRQLGVDASAILPHHVDIFGTVLWDLVEKELKAIEEAHVQMAWMPSRRVKVALDYSYILPGALISKTSIFSVFSDTAYHDAGLDLWYRVTPELRLSALFRARSFSEGGGGVLGGAGAKYLLGHRLREVVGLDLQRLTSKDANLQDNGFSQVRAYGAVAPCPRSLLSMDFFYVNFDHAVYNGSLVRNAVSAHGSAGFRLSDSMDALVSGIVNYNPASKNEVMLLGRFVWHTWLGAGERVEK